MMEKGFGAPSLWLAAVAVLAVARASSAGVQAGVGVVDMTWNVGACAGQYCDDNTGEPQALLEGGEVDPYQHHRLKTMSYGVQSRLTARAIVVEGSNGKRIALLKTDNYLAQDMLVRRVAQILEQHGTSGIHYDDILYHVTHNHSAAYYSTLSFGVWLFEDVYDQRAFEFQARKMAEAIEIAAANLRPARMGATTVRHVIYKGNVVRLATADDGTPAGYPLEYNDHGLVVMRFDDVSDPSQPAPLAVWINWGEHPESLGGYNLHSADYLGPLERFVGRDLGVPLIFSQGDVGSSENTGNAHEIRDDFGAICGYDDNRIPNTCPFDQGTLRDWNHHGYVQTERNVRFLADAIEDGWNAIGTGNATIPFTSDFEVDRVNAWVPGPLSHPYPSVSNCRTEPTVEGNPGAPILGLPDCERPGRSDDRAQMIFETMKAEGVPVPDHYDAPGFEGVEENVRLRLQAFRLGEVLLASCACEAQNDLVLNLESRTDKFTGNIYDGFDWGCLAEQQGLIPVDPVFAASCATQKNVYYDPAEFPTTIPGNNFTPAAIARMRAQVHNDAKGWDAPENVIAADSEPLDPTKIWGNFTKEELPPSLGYDLPVGIGHAGDYNGYTVSYREYMNRDSYRKALTTYGPHTADYMVTRLARMAGSLKGGPALAAEPHDALAAADEAREQAMAVAIGQVTSAAYDAYLAALRDDFGPPAALEQPQNVQRFSAATFAWRGGTTAVDNPAVRVERKIGNDWQPFADMTGEVQTMVHFPEGIPGVVDTYSGQQEWRWTANFEAYDAFPSRLGHTPSGTYHFVVDGHSQQGGSAVPYHLESGQFTVSPWTGIEVGVGNVVIAPSGDLDFTVSPIRYPRSYSSGFHYIGDTGNTRICDTCTFRPWAEHGLLATAEVEVTNGNGSTTVPATCTSTPSGATCTAPAGIGPGDSATIRIADTFGETGTASIPLP